MCGEGEDRSRVDLHKRPTCGHHDEITGSGAVPGAVRPHWDRQHQDSDTGLGEC
jgi:hypothetical protein